MCGVRCVVSLRPELGVGEWIKIWTRCGIKAVEGD